MSAAAYKNITANATTVVKTGVSILHAVVVNNPGTTWVITMYDNTAGSGSLIGTLTSPVSGGQYEYHASLSNGLTIVTSGTTAGDITVVYA